MAPTISEALQHARRHLAATSPSAQLDAELILSTAIDKPRSHLHAWPEKTLSEAQQHQVNHWVQRRQQGTPMAYLMGYRDFWKHRFEVSPDVLIPRPDTELLVETALEWMQAHALTDIADLGTGSGAIAISLALDCPAARITATDQSKAALSIARRNAAALSSPPIKWLRSDWFAQLADSSFDLIVSNPPYIAAHDPHLKRGDVQFEPKHALISPDQGLRDLLTIIQQAPAHLQADGWLMLEHGYNQADAVARLFEERNYSNIQQRRDLSQHVRVTLGQSPFNPE